MPRVLRRASALAVGLLLASGTLQAQPGTPDPSFGTDGLVAYQRAEMVDFYGLLAGADGAVLAVGSAAVGEDMHGLIVRFLADGSLDPAFGESGALAVRPGGTAGGAVSFNDVATDGTGRTVVVGGEHRQDTDRAVVIRLADGRLDPAFGTGGVSRALPTGTFASQVLALADGRLVVVGVQNNPVFRCFAARLTATGALDPTFGASGVTTFNAPDGMFNEDCAGAELLGNGHLVIGGTAIWGQKGSVGLFAVLTPSGALDPAFDDDGIATIPLCTGSCIPSGTSGFAVDSGGRFVIAGTLSLSTAPPWDTYIARMMPTGVPAPDFGTNGVVRGVVRDRGIGQSGIEDMALQPDGKLVLVGYAPVSPFSLDLLVARRLADGSPDLTFGTDGELTLGTGGFDFARAVALGPGGEAVVVGSTDDGSRIAGVVARVLGGGATGQPSHPDADVSLQVAPNPVGEAGTLTLDVGSPRRVRLALYDLLGRRVAVLHDGPLPAGTHPFPLPVSRLASGLYVVRADGSGPPASLRVVVARD